MAVCKKIRVAHRTLCAGDLRERITLEDRDIAAPGTVDFGEDFTAPVITPAAVKTLRGAAVFDASGVGVTATHDFFIRYKAGITQEKWVQWRSERYDILAVEEFEGRQEWLRLRSAFRGAVAKVVNEL